MNKFSLVFVCGGTIALALSLVMGWLGVPHMIRGQIKKNARLIKGRNTYNAWRGATTMAGITKFYIFNVTNPDEIKDGGKPKLSEIGPYTYEEKKMKVDIGPGERNHSLQYRNKQLLHFHPDISTGSEQDLITFVNVPLLILVKLSSSLEDAASIQNGMNSKLMEAGETLFKMATVREFLFDGVPIEVYLDLLQVHESNDTKIPEQFLDGKYALYEGRNGTENFLYEVNTGEHNYKDFGRIEARNNETVLPWWKNETCNSMNGTDGSIFSPFVTTDTVLAVYTQELCRKQSFIFDSNMEFKGVPGFRFKPDLKPYLSLEHNPDNWCFCANDVETKACTQDGLISTSACTDNGAPFSASLPHFYGAEQSLVESMDGLAPKAELHTTILDIEPITGKVLKAVKRMQLNADLTPVKDMNMLSKVQDLVFPILWTEESNELTENQLQFYGQIKYIGEVVEQSKWYMVTGSCVCVGIGIIVGMLRRDKSQHQLIK